MMWFIGIILGIVVCLAMLKMKIRLAQELRASRLKQCETFFQKETLVGKEPIYNYQGLKGKKCLVTGGGGFLGSHLVEKLVKLECQVTIFDLAVKLKVPEGVKVILGDLTQMDQVEKACQGMQIVFHCATANPLSPNKKLLYAVNVQGTENILRACSKTGVKRFIFTSSASVVFDGVDQINADETCPIPTTFRDTYSETKAIAEKAVLEANGQNDLLTVAIRPHGIFGPRDPHFFPTLVDNARKRKTRFQIGNGSNIVDFTYVGNVVHGHLLAAQELETSKACAGQAYFITNDEPLPFWDMLSLSLGGLGYEPPYIVLPYTLCYFVGWLMEMILPIVNLVIQTPTPTLTTSKVQLAGLHHYYSCKKAMKDLNYQPLWTLKQGILLSCNFFGDLRKDKESTGKKDSMNSSFSQQNQRIPGTYTKSEVAKHNTKEDAWIIVKDKVYDITEYVEDHPGGDSILNDAGGDATIGFYGDQHPPTVQDHIEEYYIGKLVNTN